MRKIAQAFACIVAAFAAQSADTARADDFYRGKTITIVVGGSAGGGYDILARTLAPFFGRHIPGNPDVVVQNMPGAGGIVSMNYIANAAAQDGTIIASPNNNTPFEPLFGTPEAKYDPTKLNWIGSPSPETALLAIWRATPVDTIEQARTHELRVGASGANSTPAFYAKLLNETLGLKLKLIVGFPGQNDALLAMERGEIDGYPSAFYSSLMSTRPDWIAKKMVKILVQIGKEPLKQLPDAPFAPDLAANSADRRFIEEASAPLAVGRPFVAGPKVPADRVKLLQDAMTAAFADPAFKSVADEAQLGVDAPMSGSELAAIVAKAYASPPDDIKRLRAMLGR